MSNRKKNQFLPILILVKNLAKGAFKKNEKID